GLRTGEYEEVLGGDRRYAEITMQESEKLAVRLEDEDVALTANRLAIRQHAAVEAIELGILAVGPSVDLRGSRVAVTANPFGLPIGLGQNDLALPLRVGLDALGLLLAFGAELRSDPEPLLTHALIDGIGHFARELDALHAHVDDLDAELGRALLRFDEHGVDQLGTIRRHDLLDGTPADRRLDPFLHDRGEPLPRVVFVGAHRAVVL